jgi:Cu/Ag efflux protein CusF
MKSAALTIAALTAIVPSTMIARAETVAEKKQRAAVDEAAEKAAGDIKDCGKTFKVTFDWKAFDELDWKKMGREKNNFYDSEANNLRHLGEGLNKLCGDKDYKAALAKISTIVYRSTNNDKIWVKAAVSGSKLLLDNNSFGSTRGASDYESAAKAAL